MVNQLNIHKIVQSEDWKERLKAIRLLQDNFEFFSEKKQGWDDLIALSKDECDLVNSAAQDALGFVFIHMVDKESAWNDLLKFIKDAHLLSRKPIKLLGYAFPYLKNKEQAWKDILEFTKETSTEKYGYAVYANFRYGALEALRFSFPHSSNKDEAWKDILALIKDWDDEVKSLASYTLGTVISYVNNKEIASRDILRLVKGRDITVKSHAIIALGYGFSNIFNKEQASQYFFKYARHKSALVRMSIAIALGIAFSEVFDKKRAWEELFQLTRDTDYFTRNIAAKALYRATPYMNDEGLISNNLLTLAMDKHVIVRLYAALILGSYFSKLKYREQAWNSLLRLLADKNDFVQGEAEKALGLAFPYVIDKEKAIEDLLRLINYKDDSIKGRAISVLGRAFPYVNDKDILWQGLLRLTCWDNEVVQHEAAYALVLAFPYVINKDQAFMKLLNIINHEESDVLIRISEILGSFYMEITDKNKVLQTLIYLTDDFQTEDVRASAYYSLGKISIIKAIESESNEDYIEELEKAIKYFEASSGYSRLNKFCLLFYKSFFKIICKEADAEGYINDYLNEEIIFCDSKEKKSLLDIIENLKISLEEIHNMKTVGLNTMKSALYECKRHSDRAIKLLANTDEYAPIATKLVKRGIPIFDEKIKKIIEEIQDKAEKNYQQSKGSNFEEIAHAINQETQKWKISDQEDMTRNVENIIFILKAKMLYIESNKLIYEKIEDIKKEKDLVKQYELVSLLIGLIPQGDFIMGDVFKNIQNATIINRSVVEKSFNKVKKEHNEEAAKALLLIAEFIEKSGDVSAGILFDKFNEELNKPQPKKPTLNKIWEGIEKTLPSIATISEAVAKIAKIP